MPANRDQLLYKRQKWRDFVETMDQKTDVTKLWRTIKGIDGRAKREAENEAITFKGISFLSSKQLATKFNQQFNTSKLGRHTSSRETRVVTRETKRKPLEMVRTFTTDLVMKAIKSCRNSKAFGPDKLSIFHLKHLGPRAIEYIITLFNLGHKLSGSGYMEVIINHPYTETRQLNIAVNNRRCSWISTRGRPQIEQSALLQIYQRHLIQFAITTCYQRSTHLSSLQPLRDGSPVI